MSLLVITLNRISQPIINLRVPNFFEGNGGGVVLPCTEFNTSNDYILFLNTMRCYDP